MPTAERVECLAAAVVTKIGAAAVSAVVTAKEPYNDDSGDDDNPCAAVVA